jgi:osmoprotectant transport system permease protein
MFAAAFLDDLAQAWSQSRGAFWPQTWLFLSLTVRALGLALLIGIPVGIFLTRLPRIAPAVNTLFALVQAVPALVLLALAIPLLHVGQAPAVLAAVVYSLLPVVLNTYVGITQVPGLVRDSARGMGMTGGQILWNVELPLALPVLMAGIRTAAVYASGMIVFGALIGAGGLGDFIYNGMSRDDAGLIWLGTIPVLILTFALYWSLGGLAKLSHRNSDLGMWLGGALIVVTSGYAVFALVERTARPREVDVRIGAKNFTEGQILAEILKQDLDANTSLKVEIVQNLGPSVAITAIKSGAIDLYAEYTGNLLTDKEALNLPVPEDRSTITSLVRKEAKERLGLELLEPFGLNNTYAPCVTRATAEHHRLRTISDLRRSPDVQVMIDLSFFTRPDGWPGLVEKYDLHFTKPPIQVGPDLLYKSLKEDVLVIGFATDWQIEAQDLVVLKDDLDYFPSYHAAPLIREEVLKRHPEVADVLNRLAGQIDDQTMRRLNYEVAVKKRSEVEVAREFLAERKLAR